MKLENRFLYLVAISVTVLVYDIAVMIMLPHFKGESELLGYMLEKSVNGFTSTAAIFWGWQMANWLTPNDWLEKIYESPMACAVLYVGLGYFISQVWIYG
jgi:uncharacterized membrane protein YoaT (DUF817 family)